MTNFGPADSSLRFIESQNDLKEVMTRFQKVCLLSPIYSGVRTLRVREYSKFKFRMLKFTIMYEIVFCYSTRA